MGRTPYTLASPEAGPFDLDPSPVHKASEGQEPPRVVEGGGGGAGLTHAAPNVPGKARAAGLHGRPRSTARLGPSPLTPGSPSSPFRSPAAPEASKTPLRPCGLGCRWRLQPSSAASWRVGEPQGAGLCEKAQGPGVLWSHPPTPLLLDGVWSRLGRAFGSLLEGRGCLGPSCLGRGG